MLRARIGTVCALLMVLAMGSAGAQQLEPRSFTNVPVGMNFLVAGYSYSTGGLSANPALPLTNPQLTIHAPFIGYARAIDVWGRSGKIDAIFSEACLSGSAEANGVPKTRDVCGSLDPAVRLSVNLYGAPALTPKEFAGYHQDLIVGASLQVAAPLGQYDPSRLVNLGANRWAFRPEIGISKAFDPLTVEVSLGASIYTTNDNFFGGRTREQDPIYSTQIHLIYQLPRGVWVALDGTYYTGGRTTVNGVKSDDGLSNSRAGLTVAFPVDRHHSIKVFASKGISVRYGDDFTIVGAAWQYRWGEGL